MSIEQATLTDLGTLTVKSKLFVSLLPKNSEAVVVKFEKGIRISCVIPVQKLKVRVYDDEYDTSAKCNIQTPPLMLTLKYEDTPAYGNVQVEKISIFAIDQAKTDSIWLTPYKFANVYSSGEICWGSIRTPWSLKAAFNMFWSSDFNGDLVERDESAVDYVKKYRLSRLKKQTYTNQTSFICGDRFWAAPKGSDGILVTTNAALLRQIPAEHWIRVNDELPKICLLAHRKEDGWEFESGKYKFNIPADKVTTQPAYNETVNKVKNKFAVETVDEDS